MRFLDITLKDLRQLARDRNTFLFLLFMPLLFTFMFGYAFGGFSGAEGDARLPVAWIDQDDSRLSAEYKALLEASQVARLVVFPPQAQDDAEQRVAEGELAAALVIPPDYGQNLLRGRRTPIELIGDLQTSGVTTVQSAALSAASRLDGAVRAALLLEELAGATLPFDYGLGLALAAWADPPFRVEETTSSAISEVTDSQATMAQTSPGMMLQFAIAGLLSAAQIIVVERKSRAMQRLLTTPARRADILAGHFLAILVMILVQFALLIAFGQWILGVNYLRAPAATALIALSAAVCIASLGLLVGIYARTEEQAILFSLIPMFVFAGLGGAWMPLEFTSEAFQMVGRLTPVAWAMDGFKNVSIRGLGLEAAWRPAAALWGYAVLFLAAAVWRFARMQER